VVKTIKQFKMKAIITNPIENNSIGLINEISNEFLLILSSITSSIDESMLRSKILQVSKLIDFKFFKFGFGHNHMWVKELNKEKKTGKEIIFVEF
jgi:hypothetical protein